MEAANFEAVFERELCHVQKRRSNTLASDGRGESGLPDLEANLIDQDLQSDQLRELVGELTSDEQNDAWEDGADQSCRTGLVGIAFSGGGIRSSTFNLGVLQVLHKVGIFRCADFMSTVSGGGYLGTYLSTFYSDSSRGDEKKPPYFPFQHTPGVRESDEMRHLRNHANYLAPDGLMSMLAIPIVLARGMLINFVVLLPYLLWLSALLSLLLVGGPEESSFTGIWNTGFGILPRSFPLTVGVLILIGISLCLYPVGEFLIRILKKTKDFSFRSRRMFLDSCSLLLIFLMCVFFFELQPLALNFVMRFDLSDVGVLVIGSAVANLASDKLLNLLGSVLGKIGIFLLGVLGFVSIWIVFLLLVKYLFLIQEPAFFNLMGFKVDYEILYVAVGLGLFTYTMLLVDINYTSIHNFYRDRLSEAFVHGDRVPLLSDLNTEHSPYHLVNAAINLEHPEEAYRNGRKSSFFLMSKEFCGSFRTGYCATDSWPDGGKKLDAATAMAISGAAVAPNMGKNTKSMLTFILTFLNLRLNYWLPNPAMVAAGKFEQQLYREFSGMNKVGPRYLFREMIGRLKVTTKFVNLSDGGHIENLGVYELLKRNCRLIVVGDGEADSGLSFQGLSEVIRMAQIDFGVHVVMDGLDEIRSGTQQFARGRIYYSGGRVGHLLYLKSNLGGDYNLQDTLDKEQYRTSSERDDDSLYDDNTYMAHFRHISPTFPHESTADQFFDELQFESYRALGYQVAAAALLK